MPTHFLLAQYYVQDSHQLIIVIVGEIVSIIPNGVNVKQQSYVAIDFIDSYIAANAKEFIL